MTITSLKDLEKLVKLCRKVGIDAIKVDGIEFSLTSAPTSAIRSAKKQVNIDPNSFTQSGLADARIETPDELTDEQMLFYSAQGFSEA